MKGLGEILRMMIICIVMTTMLMTNYDIDNDSDFYVGAMGGEVTKQCIGALGRERRN